MHTIRKTALTFEILVSRNGDEVALCDLGAVDCVEAVAKRGDFRARFPKSEGFTAELFMIDPEAGRSRVIDAFDLASFRERMAANARRAA